MSTLYADPSDDFSLPKRTEVRDDVDRDGNGYINCYNDLFLQADQNEDESDDEKELDFGGLMMLPNIGDDDDPV
jgi:hypothetical protein